MAKWLFDGFALRSESDGQPSRQLNRQLYLGIVEVLPYAPDVWVDEGKTQIGDEINFTKRF
jgi:hypothetical protein